MGELAGKPLASKVSSSPGGEDMKWAPVTAATGALGPVIAKLAALLGSEYKLRRRTRRDVKFIRSKLKPVHSILWNIWEKEELDAPSKALKMEALDLADDVDDAIVDFILSMERSDLTKRLVQTKIIASPFHDFKKRASDVSGRCRSKWKKKKKKKPPSSSGKHRAYPFVRRDASELVGMVGPRDALIQHLVREDERTPVELQLKTATIYGMAGVGKTTLADLVYTAIGNKFQSQAFVSVTRPGDNMRAVLSRILQQVAGHTSVPLAGTEESTQEEEHLIDIISDFLKDKRYLVIIDDLWNLREWEMITRSLPENNLGSRIVITTRINDVARMWNKRPYDADYEGPDDLFHEMFPEEENGEEWDGQIVRKSIATGMLAMKADLVAEGFDYKHPIVHMCGGMPLAVHCMLSAVAQEREKQGQNAKGCDVQAEIQKHVMENGIQNTPGFEPLVESLQLGYDDLPHHMLRTCLLYCSIYPNGYSFEWGDLVRRWISQGFVCEEEEANGYLKELINRGLIMRDIELHKILTMHPMMKNFLRWKSRQDNFITLSSEITPSYDTRRIRQLCIDSLPYRSRDDAAAEDPLSALEWFHIRSLVVFEGTERVPFDKLEGVRLLDLCPTTSVHDHHLKDICGLVRLRHLLGLTWDVSENITRRKERRTSKIFGLQSLRTFQAAVCGEELSPTRLPGFIGDLKQLKTLEMAGWVVLPKEIGALQQLQMLRISNTIIAELPMEIGSLQQLKTLDIYSSLIRELPKEIGSLQQLKTLNMQFSLITELPKEIGSLQKLNTLDMSNNRLLTVLPKDIGSLEQLKTLNISGTKITVLPKEMGKLQQLKILDISRTKITALPKEIGKLQRLEHLLMTSTEVTKIQREIGGLKELKSLKFDGKFAALPLELCALVELPECIRQALNKRDLVSELAGEMLSFQKSSSADGGLVVGAKQMHIPLWIREHFNNIFLLDIKICKLEEQGLKILREMPNLQELILRFQVVPREPIIISNQGFASLNVLTVDSRVPRVTFQEGAMPVLKSLTFQFQFYAGPPNKDPVGVNHLRSLRWIHFESNGDWYGGGGIPCISPTIDIIAKEAKEILSHVYFYVCGHGKGIYSTAA